MVLSASHPWPEDGAVLLASASTRRARVANAVGCAWIGIGIAAITACDRKTPEGAVPTASVAAAPRTPSSAAASASAPKPATSVESSSPAPLTREQAAAYTSSLARGRAATAKKDLPGAIAAFDEALAASTDDARAYSERGYAKLLAGDLEGADADLQKAIGRFSDPNLAAQIWFNAGLVAERRGKAEAARAAFARSNKLKPTTAAADKLAGKSACVTAVDRTHVAPTHFATWLDAWRALAADEAKQRSPPVVVKNDVDARAGFGVTTCDDACVGSTFETNLHLFLVRSDHTLDVQPNVAVGYFYRCGRPPSATVEGGPHLWHVQVTNTLIEVGSFCHPGTDVCQMACNGSVTWLQNDLYFDEATSERFLEIDQTGDVRNEVRLGQHDTVMDETGVTLDGPGCGKRRLSFSER